MDAISTSMQHDKPAAQDRLGYTPYVSALADMLKSEKLHTPITVGIYGPWGTGKSTFMHLLRDNLEGRDPKQQQTPLPDAPWSEPDRHCIMFEAWQFDGKEEVWKALVLTVVRYLERLHKRRQTDDPGKVIEDGLRRLIFGVTRIALNKAMNSVTGGVLDFDKLVKTWSEEKNDNTQFLNTFRSTFEDVRKGILGEGAGAEKNLYIFIDDLDRCAPDSCIEVFEAVKLFFDMEHCVFIVGVDGGVVQQGIEFKYKGSLNIRGQDYLQKMIQLPFTLPRVDPQKFSEFVEGVCQRSGLTAGLGDFVSELIIVASDGNPRRVKQIVNCVALVNRVANEIANERNNTESYEQGKLATLLVMQIRFPTAFRYFASHPETLTSINRSPEFEGKLENAVRPVYGDVVSPVAAREFVSLVDKIVRMENFKDFGGDKSEARSEIRKYLEITSVVPSEHSEEDKGRTLREAIDENQKIVEVDVPEQESADDDKLDDEADTTPMTEHAEYLSIRERGAKAWDKVETLRPWGVVIGTASLKEHLDTCNRYAGLIKKLNLALDDTANDVSADIRQNLQQTRIDHEDRNPSAASLAINAGSRYLVLISVFLFIVFVGVIADVVKSSAEYSSSFLNGRIAAIENGTFRPMSPDGRMTFDGGPQPGTTEYFLDQRSLQFWQQDAFWVDLQKTFIGPLVLSISILFLVACFCFVRSMRINSRARDVDRVVKPLWDYAD